MPHNIKYIRNRIKCLICNEVIESMHRHDFVECKCGSCFVDGGIDYQRIGYKNKNEIVILDDQDNEISIGD